MFYRSGNLGSGKLGNLPKIIQLVSEMGCEPKLSVCLQMSIVSGKLHSVLKGQTLLQISTVADVLGNWIIPPSMEC